MEMSCSFKSLVGGICGFDRRDRKKETQIIPLLAKAICFSVQRRDALIPQQYSSLEKHLDCGKHKYALEHETLLRQGNDHVLHKIGA